MAVLARTAAVVFLSVVVEMRALVAPANSAAAAVHHHRRPHRRRPTMTMTRPTAPQSLADALATVDARVRTLLIPKTRITTGLASRAVRFAAQVARTAG